MFKGPLNLFSSQGNLESKAAPKACFLAWAATKGKVPHFQQRICLKGETSSWLVGVPCVWWRKSRQITFLSIVGGFLLCAICLFCRWELVGCSLRLLKMVWWSGEEGFSRVGYSVFGSWRLWLFGGVHGGRGIVGSLRARLEKMSKLYFLRTLYSWSHGPNCGTKLTFLEFVDDYT